MLFSLYVNPKIRYSLILCSRKIYIRSKLIGTRFNGQTLCALPLNMCHFKLHSGYVGRQNFLKVNIADGVVKKLPYYFKIFNACQCQRPNLDAPPVLENIPNDNVFVGMLTLFRGKNSSHSSVVTLTY